jgi:hypothetical protein
LAFLSQILWLKNEIRPALEISALHPQPLEFRSATVGDRHGWLFDGLCLRNSIPSAVQTDGKLLDLLVVYSELEDRRAQNGGPRASGSDILARLLTKQFVSQCKKKLPQNRSS